MKPSRLRLSTPLFAALLGALAACQVSSTGSERPGLIDIEECQDCQTAYAECIESGRDGAECEAMMQECFIECDVPPDVPVDCGCDAIYDQCVAQDQDQDPNAPGGSWACEQIYQECAFACEEPPPPSPCGECDQLLLACFEEARNADDPLTVLTGCIDPYVECRISCELGDPNDGGGQDGEEPQDPGQGEECGAGCEAELLACLENGGSEEECLAAGEQCILQCEGDGGQDGEEPPQDPGQDGGDDAGCYEQFEECLWSCGDTTSRGDCEETLIECLGA